jgi:hypothetical protein
VNEPEHNQKHIGMRKWLLSVLALMLVFVSFSGQVDDAGQSYIEEGLKRALITFGVARGLNGVISVVQGTEVAVEPVGVGMTFTPGEILDPINDLIERFSWFVLASSTSLGIQKMLMNVTAWHWFSGVMAFALLGAIVSLWRPQLLGRDVNRFLFRFAFVMVALRFAVPLTAICSELVYQQFMEPQFTASQQQLEFTARTIREINQEQQAQREPEEKGLLADVKRLYQSASDAVDVETNIEAFKKAAANVSEHAINLIVVFAIQTLLFPLLFLWLLGQFVKRLLVLR